MKKTTLFLIIFTIILSAFALYSCENATTQSPIETDSPNSHSALYRSVPSAPTIQSSTYNNHPKPYWSAVSGATGYKVYRKDPSISQSFYQIATITDTSYVDYEILLGYTADGTKRMVDYYVRSYNGSGESGNSNTLRWLVYHYQL